MLARALPDRRDQSQWYLKLLVGTNFTAYGASVVSHAIIDKQLQSGLEFPVRRQQTSSFLLYVLSVQFRRILQVARGVKIYWGEFTDMQASSFKFKQNLWCYDGPLKWLTLSFLFNIFNVDQNQFVIKQIINEAASSPTWLYWLLIFQWYSQPNHRLIICFSPPSDRAEVLSFVLIPIAPPHSILTLVITVETFILCRWEECLVWRS